MLYATADVREAQLSLQMNGSLHYDRAQCSAVLRCAHCWYSSKLCTYLHSFAHIQAVYEGLVFELHSFFDD